MNEAEIGNALPLALKNLTKVFPGCAVVLIVHTNLIGDSCVIASNIEAVDADKLQRMSLEARTIVTVRQGGR